MGDGKVSNGRHIAGMGDEFYEEGEEFEIHASNAHALQDKGFVEIQGKEPPKPRARKEREPEKEEDGEWQG